MSSRENSTDLSRKPGTVSLGSIHDGIHEHRFPLTKRIDAGPKLQTAVLDVGLPQIAQTSEAAGFYACGRRDPGERKY